MMKTKAKGVIFDLDGTLIDSRLDLCNAVNHMRKACGYDELPVEKIVTFIGNGIENLVRRSTVDIENMELSALVKSMRDYYSGHLLDYTIVYPGVLDGMKKLAACGIKMAVVTNKLQDAAQTVLAGLGLEQYLSVVVGDSGRFALKPSPEAFIFVAGELKLNPEDIWVLGDHHTDMDAAQQAKMTGCFAQYGLGRLDGSHCDYQVESFGDFVRQILLD